MIRSRFKHLNILLISSIFLSSTPTLTIWESSSEQGKEFAKGIIDALYQAPNWKMQVIYKKFFGESIMQKLGNSLGDSLRDVGEMIKQSADAARDASFREYAQAIKDGLPEKEAAERAHKAALEGMSKTFKLIGNSISTLVESMGVKKALLIVAGTSVGVYGAKKGIDVLKEYILMRMNVPQLLREIKLPKQITQSITDLHYTGDTNQHIQDMINTTQAVVAAKNPGFIQRFNPLRDTSKARAKFENVMLWGPPGTGKTAIVEIIAKEANMTLFKTTGGDFAKLRGKDLQQIDETFRKARSSNRPVLFFIDEMEDLFGSRARDNLSEESRQILSKLLVEFSEPSNQIMLIGATNRPEDLDEAMHRRMPVQIEVGLPDKNGRKEIFKLYKKVFFATDNAYNKQQKISINNILTDAKITILAETVGNISPAEIQNIMITIKNRSLIQNNGIPNETIISAVIDEKLRQLDARAHGFLRTS